MPDASPIKWHRAHTTWFFETFLVQPNLPTIETFDERFAFLFNSYYVAAGPRHARPKRGLITRPNAAEVADYRAHVDAAVEQLIADASAAALAEILRILEIGLNHEEQHQELMLTDILHAFAQNPTAPGLRRRLAAAAQRRRKTAIRRPARRHPHDRPQGEGYCFDNEGPAHRVLVGPVRIARSLVTNGEWLEFMRDGGYAEAGAVALRRLGRRCRTKAGRRPATGRTTTANGSSSRSRGLRPVDPGGAGDACELLRGRRVRALGRQASADRAGVGGRGARRACSPTPSASCGNGRARAIRPIRALAPATARSANTTASS